MKKALVLIGALMLGAIASYAQGTVALYFTSSGSFAISTNGPTTGVTATSGNYYYALLIATYGGAAPSDNPNDPAWTFSGLYATNYLNSGGVRSTGNANGTAVNGWPLANGSYTASTPEYYMLVGWSASYGLNESTVVGDYNGGVNSTLTPGTYFGFSPVAYQVGGNPSQSLNAVNLFGNPSGVSGAGLNVGFDLNQVTAVPEPGTMAMAALGGLSLLAFRRKK